MVRTGAIVTVGLVVVASVTPSLAQTAPPSAQVAAPVPTRPMDPRLRLRRSIYVMEGALARAVEFGAKDLNRKLRSAIPEMMALSGAPQARGVYLEGYGIYFDVSVPVLNQVMMWSWGRVLAPDDNVVAALNEIKSYVRDEKNVTKRASLNDMLGRIELQLGPVASPSNANDGLGAGPRPAPGAAMVSPNVTTVPAPAQAAAAVAVEAAEPKFDRKYFQDPNAINRAYTESVQNALIETIVEQAHPLAIRPEEYLTIAARDNMQRDTLAPYDAFEEVVTVLLRLKGSDLAAYRAGQIDEAELRKRIEIREF